MNKKVFKNILPLLISFILAILFFFVYNQYILDRSFANIKISINQLGKIQDINLAKNIKDILDEVLIVELAKEDFNLLLYIDFSIQIIEKALRIEQIDDVKYFLGVALEKKAKKRNPLFVNLDKFFSTIFPKKKIENTTAIKKTIERLKNKLNLYKDEALGEKYLEIANLYLRIKDLENARVFCNRAIEISPNTKTALKAEFYLGFIYKLERNYNKAYSVFAKLKELLPKELAGFSLHQQADVLYRENKYEEAIELFKELFEKDPSLEIAQLAQFRAGYIYLYDMKDYNRAYEEFKKLETIEIDSSWYILKEQKRTYFIDPSTFALFNRLKTHIATKVILNIAKQLREAGFKLLQEGYKLLMEDRNEEAYLKFKEAVEKFKSALKHYPKDSISQAMIGLSFYFLKDKEGAVREIEKAIQIAPNSPLILANAGYIYSHLGMLDDAISKYKKAISYLKKSTILYYNLGTIYILNNELDKAVESFNKAIKLNPRFYYSYNNLGYIFWLKRMYKEAKINFEKAISLNPNYIEAHYNLGILFFDMGEYKKAKEEFLIVEKLKPFYKKTSQYLKQIEDKLK